MQNICREELHSSSIDSHQSAVLMATNPVYLEFPNENVGVVDSEYCFIFDEDDEEYDPFDVELVDVRKLNQLAIAYIKYHTGSPTLKQMLAHRRLAERLVWELFPSNWDQLEPTFEYDEELADAAKDNLHLLYHKSPDFAQIGCHSYRLQLLTITGREVDNTRRMTLLRLASLFPAFLMKRRC